jgi:hypothetical protein
MGRNVGMDFGSAKSCNKLNGGSNPILLRHPLGRRIEIEPIAAHETTTILRKAIPP